MPDRNHATESRSLAVLAAVWVTLNCAVVAIDVSPGGHVRPRPARPSRLALALFEGHDFPHSSPAGLVDCRLGFRLLTPPQADSGRSFPLLVFLHGAGERGRDNERQLLGLPAQMCLTEWRRRFPCYLLAPQCPEGRDWSEYMTDLEALSVHVRTHYSVDARRVYLTGLSMGGFGSWQLAARQPELFAAVVPICGGGDPNWGQALAAVPIWAVHGEDDDVVPADRSRTMIQAIRDAGGAPQYSELPGVGHNSWPHVYRDPHGVLTWLFNQVNERLPDQPPGRR